MSFTEYLWRGSGQGNLVGLDLAGCDAVGSDGSETLRGAVCLLPSSSRPKLPLLYVERTNKEH